MCFGGKTESTNNKKKNLSFEFLRIRLALELTTLKLNRKQRGTRTKVEKPHLERGTVARAQKKKVGKELKFGTHYHRPSIKHNEGIKLLCVLVCINSVRFRHLFKYCIRRIVLWTLIVF